MKYFLLALLILIVSCKNDPHSLFPKPSAVGGILDLSHWDFNSNGPVKLSGEWEFYWKQLHDPKDFTSETVHKKTGFITIPSIWNDYKINTKNLPGDGYATFKLKVKLKNKKTVLAFRIKEQNTAYKLWVNNHLLLSNGKTGKNQNSMVPQFLAQAKPFHTDKLTLDIVMQVSNYYHKKGGIKNIIHMGTANQIRRMRDRIRLFDMFLFGSLLIMALYHFGLYWLRKIDNSTLLFGLFCLFFALRILIDGSYVAEAFPLLSWWIIYKLSYFFSYIILPIFVTFMYKLYPMEFSKKLLKIIQVTGLIFILLIMVTPAKIYTHTAITYQVIILLSLIYTLFVLILAIFHKREGAAIFLGGFLVLFTSIIIFFLDDNEIISAGDYMPLGTFIFIFAQSFMLSMRISRAFSTVEVQAEEIYSIKNYLNNIINSMPSILIGIDNDSNITHLNHEAEQFSGISENAAKGQPLNKVFANLNQKIIDATNNIQSKEPIKIEKLVNKIERDIFYSNAVIYPLITNGIDGAVLIINDTTELEKKEAQLRQTQKMETVGTLAGGLAHDFNNVLAGIFGTISIMKHKISTYGKIDTPQINKYLDIVESASERAKTMVQQLLTLSRKQEINLTPVDLNLLIIDIMKICSNSFDKSIKLDPQYPDKPTMIHADPAQIEQVLLNLCINASHAMTTMKSHDEEWGGTLTISVQKIFADTHFCNTHPEAENIEYWILSVKDTGIGMNSKTLSKIFTPFFTTKEKGKGTGLGLSMVYNIIKQHKGFIDIYSEIGLGSSFNIFLPISENNMNNKESKHNEIIFEKGEGLILIIDDEEILRITSKDMLEECGYTTVTAANGKEGIELFRKHNRKIKAVLLDMIMPELSGKDTFLQLKKIDPNIKVILSSGFKQDERVEDVLKLGVKGFIQKPYSLINLSKTIKNIIGDD